MECHSQTFTNKHPQMWHGLFLWIIGLFFCLYVRNDASVCATWLTPLYVRHDSPLHRLGAARAPNISMTCVTWRIHTCDMTSFACVTVTHRNESCVDMCDMTHSHVWHDVIDMCDMASLTCVTWVGDFAYTPRIIRRCDMSHSHVWHNSFLWVTWLIPTCGIPPLRVWHDSLLCVCDMTHRSTGWAPRGHRKHHASCGIRYESRCPLI